MAFLNSDCSLARWAAITLLLTLGGALGKAGAQTAVEGTQVTVNGPQGSLLSVDGKPIGTLPLPTHLILSPGEHRFRLEQGIKRAESAPMMLPPNRQAELQLTLAGRNLVAVLSLMPAVLLVLSLHGLPAALPERLTRTLATAVMEEHAVLLVRDNPLAPQYLQPALMRCLDSQDCHEALAPKEGASYVLSVDIDGDGAAGTAALRIRATLLDLRTRDIGARREEACPPGDEGLLSRRLSTLVRKLFAETVSRPRGILAITASPTPASVFLDGRWLGVTPFEQETFVGPRAVEVKSDGYLSQRQRVEVPAGQLVTVEFALLRAPIPVREKRSRPLWRLVTGGALLGTGGLLAGFGASALAQNGQCQDRSNDFATCSPFYSTLPVGASLLGSGVALLITGTVMLAVPPMRKRVGDSTALHSPH